MTVVTLLEASPDAMDALRRFFGVSQANAETLSRYIFTYGSNASWWACAGAPHISPLHTKRQPTETAAVEALILLLEHGALK